jgi:peptide chain release factor 2
MKNLSDYKEEVEHWDQLVKRIEDTLELSQLDDPSLEGELDNETKSIAKELDQLSLSILLGGKYDRGNALLTINTGEGGTDAQIGLPCSNGCIYDIVNARDFRPRSSIKTKGKKPA